MPRCRAQHLGFEPLTSRPKLRDQRGQTESMLFISCLAVSCAGACSQPSRRVTCAQVIASITQEREKGQRQRSTAVSTNGKTYRPHCNFKAFSSAILTTLADTGSFVSQTVMRWVSTAGSFSRTQEGFQEFRTLMESGS